MLETFNAFSPANIIDVCYCSSTSVVVILTFQCFVSSYDASNWAKHFIHENFIPKVFCNISAGNFTLAQSLIVNFWYTYALTFAAQEYLAVNETQISDHNQIMHLHVCL